MGFVSCDITMMAGFQIETILSSYHSRLYEVSSQTGDHFYVDSLFGAGTGVIKILTPLDFESMDIDTLTIDVTVAHPGDGIPQNTTTVTITVTGRASFFKQQQIQKHVSTVQCIGLSHFAR